VNKYLDFVTFDSRTKAVLMLILGITAGLTTMPVLAAVATDGGQAINWWEMGMTLLGGLAVFLFGMEQMADALKKVAGDSMKQILARLTNSRIMGLITGAFVTAIIQSSSVTTVMLVGFVTAGLMSMSQAIGVILGADIGTTITAQIVAFKGYCQVNDILTSQPIDGYIPLLSGHNLGACHLLPFTKCPRAKLAIVNRTRQVPTQPEQIAYHAINRKKALSLSR